MGYSISLAVSVNILTNDKVQTVRVMYFIVFNLIVRVQHSDIEGCFIEVYPSCDSWIFSCTCDIQPSVNASACTINSPKRESLNAF